MGVAEGIRYGSNSCPFSSCVRRALSDARREFGLLEDAISGVELFFSYSHFIGRHAFCLKFDSLDEGTSAWEQLQAAKGQELFKGASVTAAYTPRAAKEQWQRVKSTFLQLAAANRCYARSQAVSLEERLSKRLQQLEDLYRPKRLERECVLWKRSHRFFGNACSTSHSGSSAQLSH